MTDVDLATADGQDRYVPTATRDITSAGHEGVYEWIAEHLVKAGMKAIGRPAGPVRPPLTDLTPAELEELTRLIAGRS